MSDQMQVKNTTVKLIKGDITDLEIQSFVFYAREDLELGSGFGTAIAMRGGPSVQEELKQLGGADATSAVVTKAGNMKAEFIVHAVGPKFQEEELETKLETTILNALKEADAKGITAIAFPPMGAGFYGVPLPTSANITLSTIKEYLNGDTGIKEVVVCLMDNREFEPFQQKLTSMN
jgi:O-acetyl-ADP-ribose deacetylase (regulator of RNase III)